MLRNHTVENHISHPVVPLHPLSNTGAILPSKTIRNVGIDWLQVSFKGRLAFSSKYVVKQMDIETKIFKMVSGIYYNNELIATATHTPKSPILDPALVIIKIENKQLYVSDPVQLMQDFQKEFNLTFVNITRIDLFRDFNELKYGLTANNLITKFVKGEYLRKGKGEFRLIGNSCRGIDYSYLRFGGNTSDFQVYMYNKSKEMREVKHKPWIVERAGVVGVDTSRDFWRLEVSCKNCKKEVVSLKTGEFKVPDLTYFEDDRNVQSYYYALISKYFGFCHNTGKSRLSREKPVEIFTEEEESVKVYNPTNCVSSNRTNKMVLRHLENYCEFMRGESIMGDLDRRVFIEDYIHVHALEDYYVNKVSLGYRLL